MSTSSKDIVFITFINLKKIYQSIELLGLQSRAQRIAAFATLQYSYNLAHDFFRTICEILFLGADLFLISLTELLYSITVINLPNETPSNVMSCCGVSHSQPRPYSYPLTVRSQGTMGMLYAVGERIKSHYY